MDRRNWSDRPPESVFAEEPDWENSKEKKLKLWREGWRILNRNACRHRAVFFCGIPVYVAWRDEK